MALSAILRKSASSLALTASRLARANRNYQSAVFSASSHLNRKPTLGSFVPDFEFSSATETKKCSSNIESLLQAIDSEIKHADDHDCVEETPIEFTFEVLRTIDSHDQDCFNVELTKKFQDELVEVSSYIDVHETLEDMQFFVTISKHGGSSLEFDCYHTHDGISISSSIIVENSDGTKQYILDLDENLNKAFQKFLEVRGIKPSIIDFIFKCISNKKTQRNLMVLKKIKTFIEQFA